ncbi:MAG: hypothetical protein NWE89_00585 [Candidatus Bathyarchaeota archaeon]|nr:hypothetical protein [Candidatus Bathyarchaeota archaeon]
MVRLYLDLETYRPNVKDAFIGERIISAGIIVDKTAYHERSLNRDIEPILFSEWDGYDEKTIVSKVEETVRSSQTEHPFTVLVGFNILRFDIPLLIAKSGKASQRLIEASSKLWYDAFTIDLMQQILAANWNRFKGSGMSNVVSTAIKLGMNPPDYPSSGAQIKGLYETGKFDEIETHLKQDLKIIRWLDLYGVRHLIEQGVKEQRPLFQKLSS